MTTMTMDRTHAPAGAFGRIWSVVRLNLVNPSTAMILPWIILGLIFLVNLVIWVILARTLSGEDLQDATDGMSYSGASVFIFVYMLVVAVQTMNLTFPFALGYGVTRRDFYLGSALTFVLLSAMYAVGLTILASIEEATGGWGLGGSMFTALYFGDGLWFERLWIFFVAFLFFFFLGAVYAAVYVRWKSRGATALSIGLTVLIVALAALFTFTETWHLVGEFFAGAGFLGAYTWSLALTAIAGIAGFFILRRATPKN